MAFGIEWKNFTVVRNHKNKTTDSMQFRTIVAEVSSFVSNPVVGSGTQIRCVWGPE